MNKLSIVMIGLLVAIAILPELVVTGADAKGVPQNREYTLGQIAIMLVIPLGLTGALGLVLGISRMSNF